jgi:5-methylcytosine-specific restriction endonuclease McrA
MDLLEIRRQSEQLQVETWADFWSLVVECGSIVKEINPNKRRAWLSHVIQELHREQQGLCALGGELLSLSECTVDHKIPFCYGGGHERANIQLACLKHNQQKGRSGVDPSDLLRYLEDRYMNR